MSAGKWSELETALGRALPPGDRASVESLNDLPEGVVAQAKGLQSAQLVRQLLEYYCGLQCRPYLTDFIGKVIEGHTSASRWRRVDGLVPAQSLAAQLCLDREALLAPLGGYSGMRIIPDQSSWKAGTSWVGAPVRSRCDADYRSAAPEGAVSVVSPAIEAAPDEDVTVRRWIASRIARCMAAGEPPGVQALFSAVPLLPGVDRWSQDARIALAALLREFRDLPVDERAIPGFRGPDAWYRRCDCPA